MQKLASVLLTFLCFAFISPPVVQAKDIGKQETLAKQMLNDAFVFPAYAVIAEGIELAISLEQDAPAAVGIQTKTPTVEVKARVTVGSITHRRLCVASNYSLKGFTVRYVPKLYNLHIDPGLRGC